MVNSQALGFVLEKCNQTLPFSLYEVIEHIIECTGYMSLGESGNDLFLRGGDREVLERRRIPDNFFDIIDHKFNFEQH